MTDPPEMSPLDHLREHLGLAIAVAGALAVVFRLLAVAEYDTDTALAILQISGTAEIAVGTLMTVLPLVEMLGLAVLAIAILVFDGPRSRLAVLVGAAVVLALAVSFAPYSPLLDGFYVVLVPLALVGRRLIRGTAPGDADDIKRKSVIALLACVAVMLAGSVAFGPSAWLPAEAVVADGQPYVGYVLTSGSDGASLLLDQSRRVVHVGPLTRRVLCRPASRRDEQSLAAAIGLTGRPRYAVCHPSLVS